jgi:uncharacterized membrane protein
MKSMIGLTFLDYAAFVWFLTCWIGLTFYADYGERSAHGVSKIVDGFRRQWLMNMVGREVRMIDTLIQGNLLNGVAFFASTTLLFLGGLLTVLGATDQAAEVVGHLPFTPKISRAVWELKILLLVLIFVYAFFKFAWCYRLFNYCTILLGAAPQEARKSEQSKRFAERVARLHALAGRHFNRGLRAYFFSLAGLAWFIHPVVFMAATTWVTFIVHRREFRSSSFLILDELRRDAEWDPSGHTPENNK